MTNSPSPQDVSLAPRPWMTGDDLPEVGSQALISGANMDVESDQHRAYTWRTVIGYGENDKFICLQTTGCWPTVERTENCWFAEIKQVRRASPADGVVVPRGEVTDEWADRFCEAVNWSPDGQERKVVEGEMRCVNFRQIAKGHILAAIATGPEAASPALAATSVNLGAQNGPAVSDPSEYDECLASGGGEAIEAWFALRDGALDYVVHLGPGSTPEDYAHCETPVERVTIIRSGGQPALAGGGEPFAHRLLSEFCACYGEAWPAKTCQTEASRLADWLVKSSSDIVRDLVEMHKLAVAAVSDKHSRLEEHFFTRGALADAAFKLSDTLISAAVAIECATPPSADADKLLIAREALEQWKCPSCGGSRVYHQRSKHGEEHVHCRVCEATGLHPTARQALARLSTT